MLIGDITKKYSNIDGISYTNILTNNDFENNLTGWSKIYTGLGEIVTTESKFGSKSYHTNCTGTDKVMLSSPIFTASLNDKLYISCWFKKIRNTSGSFNILVQKASGGWSEEIVSNSSFASAPLNTWVRGSVIRTILSSYASLNSQIYIGEYSSFDAEAYVDGVLVVNLTALGYADKDLAWCDANLPFKA